MKNRNMFLSRLKLIGQYVFVVAIIAFLCSCQVDQNILTSTTQEGTTSSESVPIITPTNINLWSLVNYHPASIDNTYLPITPVSELHETGFYNDNVDITNYRLSIYGLVDKPLSITYDALLEYPPVTDTVLLICPQFFVDNATWTGVPVATLLKAAGIKAGASNVTFYALDDYHVTITLEKALKQGTFLAYSVDGEVLPDAHGYPLRLVVTGDYGGTWIKWVDRIEVI